MWNPFRRKNNPDGSAVLMRHRLTGTKFWVTSGPNGEEKTNLSPMQPLVLPCEKLPLGTKIEIYLGNGKNAEV